MLKDVAVSVSPPVGTRGVSVTRSVLRDPMTVMVLGDMLGSRGGGYPRIRKGVGHVLVVFELAIQVPTAS